MSKTPEIRPNQAANILPVIWVIIVIVLCIALFFSLSPLEKQFKQFISDFTAAELPVISPTINSVETLSPTTKISPTITPKPTKKVVACIKYQIREGEFVSNKCYTPADRDSLIYYLNRLDSANFDLQGAQGTIDITCKCRSAEECDFFKDSCAKAQQQKSQAEASINQYRATIRALINQAK